jgi:hypothetical protein
MPTNASRGAPPAARGGATGAAAAQPAGSGFAAVQAQLMRGMGDLSMNGPALDETNYEFEEENEKKNSMDDIDDFERRLAGNGAAPRAMSKVTAKPAAALAAKQVKKTGAEYVKSAQRPRKKKGDDEDDADDAKQAMSDLDRFERDHGGLSDDD